MISSNWQHHLGYAHLTCLTWSRRRHSGLCVVSNPQVLPEQHWKQFCTPVENLRMCARLFSVLPLKLSNFFNILWFFKNDPPASTVFDHWSFTNISPPSCYLSWHVEHCSFRVTLYIIVHLNLISIQLVEIIHISLSSWFHTCISSATGFLFSLSYSYKGWKSIFYHLNSHSLSNKCNIFMNFRPCVILIFVIFTS